MSRTPTNPVLKGESTGIHADAPPRLSPRIYRLLVHGGESHRYRDDLAVVGAITAEAARAGHDFEYLRSLLANERNAGGEWYRCRVATDGQRQGDRTLQRLFERSVGQFRPSLNSATEVRVLLWGIQHAAVEREWAGRAGSTRLKVFLAHTSVGMTVGKLTYTASVRQLADLAGVYRTVAQKRSEELRTDGLIRLVEPASGTKPNCWKLCEEPWQQLDPVGPSLYRSITGSCLHPAFRYGTGLDGRVWSSLDHDDSITVSELAAVLTLKASTLRAKLRNLERAGLAAHDDDGHWQRLDPPDLLDQIAENTGMVERNRRQRERHKVEQAEHRRNLRRLANGDKR